MSLYEFEHVLDKLEVGFLHFRQDGYIETQVASKTYRSVTYTLLAHEEQGGHTTISCFVPRSEKRIRNVDKLLKLIAARETEILVEFDRSYNNFSIVSYLSPGAHEEELEQFCHECDRVYPILYEVSMQGKWSTRFVAMALLPSDLMPQA